jgi:hypothetical protein
VVVALRMSRSYFRAIDTKMAFTVARLFLGIGQDRDMAPASLIWLYHNHPAS